MLELIKHYLAMGGLSPEYIGHLSPWVALVLLAVSAYLILKVVASITDKVVQRLIKVSKNNWDDKLFNSGFFRYAVHLAPIIFLSLFVPEVFRQFEIWKATLEKGITLYLIITFLLATNALISAASTIYASHEVSKRVPLMGVFQITRLIVSIIAILLVLAVIMDKSPAVLLSGIGALTAILLLVFKDTIQGLVAGIQIAAHKMLAHGDWLEMPAQGVDGTVLEVGLNTVKVRNWDNTISYLPTYTLISQPYKNWRGMEESTGRRFKRRLVIDPDSVQALENSEFKTNLGAFRQEIIEYLASHQQVNKELTQLVRIVNPDQYGVHLEVYFFITDKRWVYFEQIAAEVYEDLIVMLKKHQLKISTIKSVVN